MWVTRTEWVPVTKTRMNKAAQAYVKTGYFPWLTKKQILESIMQSEAQGLSWTRELMKLRRPK